MGPPHSSVEAEENGVLIDRYKPNTRSFLIYGKIYLITDSWTGYFLPQRNTKKVFREGYDLFIVLKEKTPGGSSVKSIPVHLMDIFRYDGKKYGYTNGVGYQSGMLSVDFRSDLKPIADDTIHFTVFDDRGKQHVYFVKEKSASH